MEEAVALSGPLGYDDAVEHKAMLVWRGYTNLKIVSDMPGMPPTGTNWVMPEEEWAWEYLKMRNRHANGY